MPHRFPLKEIAFQAGLSLATVDRVVNERPGVRRVTRARVAAAVRELERQTAKAPARGRRMSVDLVMEAPTRFSRAVRQAIEAEMPALRPASLRARFHVAETMPGPEIVRVLRQIRRRGSDGVILKAPRDAGVVDEARALMAQGIPIVTYVTDLPAPCRVAYVGMDNSAAGAAAGWLMGHMLMADPCDVLIPLSRAEFEGEGARANGFRAAMAKTFPHIGLQEVAGGQGLSRETGEAVVDALAKFPEVEAVYSVGGANRAILDAFEAVGRSLRIFAAHDLDAANRTLLKAERLTFVIHHDLRQDARAMGQIFLQYHRMLPTTFDIPTSQFSIATPGDV